jgi:tetratricopeptide (TPR) repeat protein
VAVAAALLLLAGAWLATRPRRAATVHDGTTGARQAPPAFVERRVAVAPFENQTGDSSLARLGRLTSDWIAQGLAEAGFAEVVDPETVRLTWPAAPNARALAAATRARLVVSGTYYREGDTLRLLARINDAAEDKLLRALPPVSAPAGDPQRAVAALRARALGALAALLDERAAGWVSTLPPSLEAYDHWSAGLERYFRLDHRGAIPEFAAAVRLDSTFILPLILSAQSHREIGDPAGADSVLRIVEAAPPSRLMPQDRQIARATRAELRGDFTAALEAIREGARVAPASATIAFGVGLCAVRVNRPREAIAALGRFDASQPPLRSWSPYLPLLAYAHHLLGEYRTELAVARRARGLHPGVGGVVYAEARALAVLSEVAEVERRVTEAAGLPPGPSGAAPANVMRLIGAELRTHGHEAAAQRAFAAALAWLDARPAEERATPSRRRLRALVLYDLRRLDEARPLFDRLAAEQPRDPEFRGYLGALAARRGDRAAALAADTALAALPGPYLAGQHTYWRARIAALLGQHERAVTLLRDALLEGRTYFDVHPEADFAALRAVPSFQELVRPKG